MKYEDGLQMCDGSKDTPSYHNRQQTTLVRLFRCGLMSPISRNRTAQCWVHLLGISGKTRGQQPCLEINARRVETSETDAANTLVISKRSPHAPQQVSSPKYELQPPCKLNHCSINSNTGLGPRKLPRRARRRVRDTKPQPLARLINLRTATRNHVCLSTV